MDLGDDNKDLAADVDDGIYDNDDEEALESDEDEDKIVGLDLEEDTEGKLQPICVRTRPDTPLQSLCISCLSTRSCQRRSRCECSKNRRRTLALSSLRQTSQRRPSRFQT